MDSELVGRRRYFDPDVISLIRNTGGLVDPRSSVLTQARQLNREFADLDGDFSNPMKRLAILASLRGFRLQEMEARFARSEPRDAVIVPTNGAKGGVIFYNPERPRGRVAFSIAHEISHTFFPNSSSGARYRSICAAGSQRARELESLCDLGGSELLMPQEEFLRVTAHRMGFDVVDGACAAFGASFEAALFRLATTYPGLAVAGLLRYRLRVDEQRRRRAEEEQGTLFDGAVCAKDKQQPKYRRQSFLTSEFADTDDHIVRWNKSFDEGSCVYEAGRERKWCSGIESLPNNSQLRGQIEAMPSRYQRDESDPDFPDVLFVWWR